MSIYEITLKNKKTSQEISKNVDLFYILQNPESELDKFVTDMKKTLDDNKEVF